MKKYKHGRLTINKSVRLNGKIYYECTCECGKTKLVYSSNLKRTHSCGCLNSEIVRKRSTTHGMRKSDEYRIWGGMKYRCLNKNCSKYPSYGGRGITVCERWMIFKNFYDDMGNRPSKHHSIDRINNDLGYSKKNCRWVINKKQANNTRRNHLITHNNKTQSLRLWMDELGLNYNTVKGRIRRGWSFEKAITV